jgi:primary-amine oxidase
LLAFLLLAASAAQSQPALPKVEHPLEALRSSEYWTVYDVLRASGKVDADTWYASVLLHAPPKEKVLSWKKGDPIPRSAGVVLLRKGMAIEARVDIAARKLESFQEVKGVHAPVVEHEFAELGGLIKKDPAVIAALERRGIKDLTTVECVPLPYGYFAIPELATKRAFYGGCSDNHGAHLTWGRSIEGLNVLVDAVERKVLKVVDSGPVVPVPTAPTNFEELPAIARHGTKPIVVSQPQGASFEIDGNEISWQNWKFRYRLDPRVGAVVNLVHYQDGGKSRSVLYEGSASELFVPYMDPADGWATRVFIDAGEFFHSGFLKPLRPGMDCPAYAEYIDGLVPNERGAPVLKANLACLYETATGNPAWRHHENNTVWGRPSRTLVLRTAAVIGNYDYILDWRFEQDGSIKIAVGATGIIETKSVLAKNAAGGGAAHSHGGPGAPDEYGRFVADNTIGVNHDHFFSFRLDLDVDGRNNNFMAHRMKRRMLPAETNRKSIWVVEPVLARKEQDAMLDIRMDQPSMWVFENPGVKGPLGYPTGYEIMPGGNASSLLDPDDTAQKAGAFSNHHLWVTPYKAGELYASGVYPTASKGDNDGLAVWTKANRPIENTDLVAWYTLGFHHMPRAEDWPVMPVMWHQVEIRPFGFFAQNPVMTLPNQP